MARIPWDNEAPDQGFPASGVDGIEQPAIAALTPHLQQELPELHELEARNRAALCLCDRWAEQDITLQEQIDANPTWEMPAPRPMPGIETSATWLSGGRGPARAGESRGRRRPVRRLKNVG